MTETFIFMFCLILALPIVFNKLLEKNKKNKKMKLIWKLKLMVKNMSNNQIIQNNRGSGGQISGDQNRRSKIFWSGDWIILSLFRKFKVVKIIRSPEIHKIKRLVTSTIRRLKVAKIMKLLISWKKWLLISWNLASWSLPIQTLLLKKRHLEVIFSDQPVKRNNDWKTLILKQICNKQTFESILIL